MTKNVFTQFSCSVREEGMRVAKRKSLAAKRGRSGVAGKTECVVMEALPERP